MNIPRVYLYVDGECHYAMAEKCWRKIHGEDADLNSLTTRPSGDRVRIFHYKPAYFFWDSDLPALFLKPIPNINPATIARRVYFTSFTGTDTGLQEARVNIREAGFEPEIVLERKDQWDQRQNRRKDDRLIVKPKGVDIGLSVRMLEDAYHDNYDWCVLATSDIDYLPVIKAVRRMGKQVFVLGYSEGIPKDSKDSPFLYLPEQFVDIGQPFMRENYVLKRS